MVSWKILCTAPRIAVSLQPLITEATANALVAHARPAMLKQEPAPHEWPDVDYRSLSLAACGPGMAEILDASGLPEVAARESGMPVCVSEDIMIARTTTARGSQTSAPAPARNRVMNVHHDHHNEREARRITFMVNLATIDAEEHGGETWFPVANARASDPLVLSLNESYAGGSRHLLPSSDIAIECARGLGEWRDAVRCGKDLGGSSGGVGVVASAGMALMFDSEPCAGAWHSPTVVTGPAEKWTITWFKAVPPAWPDSLLGI
jgi:hypothetical protein